MMVGPDEQKGVPLSTLLARFGHRVYAVNCGRKAFQKMIAVDFDLIVVMDNLFDMSGQDFVKRLENREDRRKVVFFTGKWNVEVGTLIIILIAAQKVLIWWFGTFTGF